MRRHMKAVFVSTLFAALLLLAPGCAIGPYEGLSSTGSEQSAQTEQLPQAADLASLPAFSGEPVAILADNRPSFSEADLAREPFLEFAPLDSLGRCGAAFALLGPESMPEEERGSIGDVEPSGWHLVKYDIVDGKYLYNRCHLIAHRLCGENANERNLITGTRFLNAEGMLPYEDAVASYIEATGNHVLMRVTPLFEGDELVARGVQIEAQSIEDGGAGVRFNVYAYNVQPGVGIDYATGRAGSTARSIRRSPWTLRGTPTFSTATRSVFTGPTALRWRIWAKGTSKGSTARAKRRSREGTSPAVGAIPKWRVGLFRRLPRSCWHAARSVAPCAHVPLLFSRGWGGGVGYNPSVRLFSIGRF